MGTKKKCVKGFECGYTCIEQGLKCSDKKQAEPKTYLSKLANLINEPKTYVPKVSTPKPPKQPKQPKVATPKSGTHNEYIEKAKKFLVTSGAQGDLTPDDMNKLIKKVISFHNVPKADIDRNMEGIKFDDSPNLEATKKAVFFFNRLLGGQVMKKISRVMSKRDRAMAVVDAGLVDVGLRKQTILKMVLHELSHFLETDPAIAKASRDFIASRATSNKPERLSILTGVVGYADSEKAYPDNFISPYVGKVYSDGKTEVPSKGIEHFNSVESMMTLYKKDPEHFLFSLGLILGQSKKINA